ncbi:MAG: hypothetical protein FJW96_10210 [Actinobacteria bacterium]|nr:hypothetical protein [Actinomycetota bacterium]
MSDFSMSIRCPRGTLLVGGYSAVPEGVDAVHASDERGRPLIPSTAIRGALRETLEALLRGAGLPSCSGGDGGDPVDPSSAASAPCSLAQGRPCQACRLFGTQQRDGRGGRGALVLENARLEDGREESWQVRPGVAIARESRAASGKLLFNRLVPDLGERIFVSRGRLIDPDPALRCLLEATTRAATHLGAGRSRGFGRVEICLRWPESVDPPPEPPANAGDRLRVRAKLLSPAAIGLGASDDWFRDTRREIPGSALRGAVGFALAEVLENPDENADFQALVGENGARFGFLDPVATEGSGPSYPWPLTARRCKFEPTEHGVVDTLLDRLAVEMCQTGAQAAKVERTSKNGCAVQGCGGPLRACSGSRRAARAPDIRQVTRVALDRSRSSAKSGALFTHQMLEAGQHFEGVIDRIPEAGMGLLVRALAMPLSVGRGQSMGWGRLEIRLIEERTETALEDRSSAFVKALEARLRRAGIEPKGITGFLPVVLASPLVGRAGEPDDPVVSLRAAMGAEAELVLAVRRFVREGAWDQRAGKVSRTVATAAGSVFVFRIESGHLIDVAKRLESDGAGARREQGFGRLACFDPALCG